MLGLPVDLCRLGGVQLAATSDEVLTGVSTWISRDVLVIATVADVDPRIVGDRPRAEQLEQRRLAEPGRDVDEKLIDQTEVAVGQVLDHVPREVVNPVVRSDAVDVLLQPLLGNLDAPDRVAFDINLQLLF